MTITASKITYGAVVGPDEGVTATKMTYGVVVGPDSGITATKITYGIIVDTLTPESIGGRRRQMSIVN